MIMIKVRTLKAVIRRLYAIFNRPDVAGAVLQTPL